MSEKRTIQRDEVRKETEWRFRCFYDFTPVLSELDLSQEVLRDNAKGSPFLFSRIQSSLIQDFRTLGSASQQEKKRSLSYFCLYVKRTVCHRQSHKSQDHYIIKFQLFLMLIFLTFKLYVQVSVCLLVCHVYLSVHGSQRRHQFTLDLEL